MGIKQLNILQSAQLLNYIRDNYAAFELSDKDFAAKASQELGFHCSFWNVNQRRELLGIQATAKVMAAKKKATKKKSIAEDLQDYIAALEKRVTSLEFEIAALKNRPFDAYKK